MQIFEDRQKQFIVHTFCKIFYAFEIWDSGERLIPKLLFAYDKGILKLSRQKILKYNDRALEPRNRTK